MDFKNVLACLTEGRKPEVTVHVYANKKWLSFEKMSNATVIPRKLPGYDFDRSDMQKIEDYMQAKKSFYVVGYKDDDGFKYPLINTSLDKINKDMELNIPAP